MTIVIKIRLLTIYFGSMYRFDELDDCNSYCISSCTLYFVKQTLSTKPYKNNLILGVESRKRFSQSQTKRNVCPCKKKEKWILVIKSDSFFSKINLKLCCFIVDFMGVFYGGISLIRNAYLGPLTRVRKIFLLIFKVFWR